MIVILWALLAWSIPIQVGKNAFFSYASKCIEKSNKTILEVMIAEDTRGFAKVMRSSCEPFMQCPQVIYSASVLIRSNHKVTLTHVIKIVDFHSGDNFLSKLSYKWVQHSKYQVPNSKVSSLGRGFIVFIVLHLNNNLKIRNTES